MKIRERKDPSLGVIQKCEPHERNWCAPRFEERTPDDTLLNERCARRVPWDLAKIVYKRRKTDKTTFYSPIEARAMPAPTSKLPDLSSDEMDTLRRSRMPTTVVTANGEVQTIEEAQVYIHDFDLFVTVQSLEVTPAALSLEKSSAKKMDIPMSGPAGKNLG